MPQARTNRRAASTYLVHFFGGGLEEEGRYVVERYETAASGEIRPLGVDCFPGQPAPGRHDISIPAAVRN